MDNYYCIYGDNNNFNYIIVKNIIDSNVKYLPYYDTRAIKINEHIIDFDEIIGINLFDDFTDYFETYNLEIVNTIFP